MGVSGGGWDSALWDNSYWGVASNGIAMSATLITDTLKRIITQDPANAQQIYASVLIDGVEYAQECESLETYAGADASFPYAQITLARSAITGLLLKSSTVKISMYFILDDGSTFGQDIFNGVVSTVTPYKGTESQTIVIIAKHTLETALNAEPVNSGAWPTGKSAKTIILEEIAAAGITSAIVEMTDYTPVTEEMVTLGFDTKISLINALASGGALATCSIDAVGAMTIYPVMTEPVSSLSITEAALLSFDSNEKTDLCNDIDGEGTAWTLDEETAEYTSAVIAGTYSDTADITLRGATVAGTGFTSPYLQTVGELNTLAESVVKSSLLMSASWSSPINPFLAVGNGVTVTLDGESAQLVKITGIRHSFSWSGNAGAWDDLTGLVMP